MNKRKYLKLGVTNFVIGLCLIGAAFYKNYVGADALDAVESGVKVAGFAMIGGIVFLTVSFYCLVFVFVDR